MNAPRNLLCSTLTLLVLAASASAASYDHIDQLALRLEKQGRALTSELSEHYRHASHYGHLIADAREICRSAKHIHKVAHFSGNAFHLKNDLAELDRSFHHMEKVLAEINSDAWHGYGHTDGRAGHVSQLMHSIEDTIHHLRDDIRQMTRRHYRPSHSGHGGHGRHVRRGVYYKPGPGGGVNIRAGNFGIRIGF